MEMVSGSNRLVWRRRIQLSRGHRIERPKMLESASHLGIRRVRGRLAWHHALVILSHRRLQCQRMAWPA